MAETWLDYLDSLRPDEKYLDLFEESIRHSWQEMTKESDLARSLASRRVEALLASQMSAISNSIPDWVAQSSYLVQQYRDVGLWGTQAS